tara:strand:- start:8 stop:229 length:222 start_codon:yes stop_codon:yes gene_type:complete
MEDGIKNIRLTETRAQMTFCSSCKTCPSIDISTESDKVVIGGDDEGYTEFTKDQFELFMNQIKKGTFDKYLNK